MTTLTLLKTKFLLADDDPDDAQLFCEALRQIAGVMECYKVEHGGEVIELLSGGKIGKPDVIFLDINMPVMNGWECLQELKRDAVYQSIPTIMYSTSSAKRDIDQAYRMGAFLFLTKPEDFRELRKILEIVATNPQESLLTNLKGFESVKVN